LTRAGDACRTLGLLDKARSYYAEALAVGYDLFAELGLAKIEAIEGQWSHALQRLEALRGRESTNLRVAADLADCLQMSGSFDKAAALVKTLTIDAGTPAALARRIEELRQDILH
jgi:thioredoxin-like negative regulator of GroEL